MRTLRYAACAAFFMLACEEEILPAPDLYAPPLQVMAPEPVRDVRIGDTVEIATPHVEGGTPRYTWTYSTDVDSYYLHIVDTDPLRVYASDGGWPRITAAVNDANGKADTVEIEERLIPQSPVEGRWHMLHTIDADTVELWLDLMPGHPWCSQAPMWSRCVSDNCSTMSDGYPDIFPCPQRSFNIGGQVKWRVGDNEALWPDPFKWLPWPRNNFVTWLREPNIVLNVGVPQELGICARGTYATFEGSVSEDRQTMTVNASYNCDYVHIGVPAPWNPSGTFTLHRQEIPR
ncbi:MAG: hypothetical protein OXR82_17545 [Gammaproteobacteria bacterium]|nr:hypothetical protein [Gammaproteobacteria bacterium]